MFLPGDRFELLQVVGEGSFGTVYRGKDKADGSLVAIKLLQHSLNKAAAARFEREVSLLAELSHPSIVRYLAHGRTLQGQSYLVMEWLDGQTLDARLHAGALSVADTLRLAGRVVDGLAAAEHKSIVHRDIKPSNLLLCGGNAADTKILDFGLARRRDAAVDITGTGIAVGTPLYMSPEQARGDRELDARSDVFSLGCVLYECLAGASPFRGADCLATLAKICLEEVAPLDELRSDLPVGLAALVRSMLQKRAPARPSIAQVADELARLSTRCQDPVARTVALTMHAGLPPAEPADADAAGSEAGRSSSRPSLTPRAEQRVLCTVFVGRTARALEEPDTDGELRALLDVHGAHCERLFDGTRVLTMAPHLALSDQAVAAARCALGIRRLSSDVPIAVCTGRAPAESALSLGTLLEQGAAVLARARAGAVHIDEVSASLLQARFELRPEKGENELLAERREGDAPRTLHGKITPFVGRRFELEQLQATLRECCEERVARTVLVTAPAGVGKSRLRHELLQRLGSSLDELWHLVARGDSMRANVPFGVLAPALRSWAQIDQADTPAVKRDKLRARVAAVVPPERANLMPELLGEMIGVTFAEEGNAGLAAVRHDAQLMADRMLSTFLAWLETLARTKPVLFVVEDLHWSDQASVRFLDAAMRSLGELPIMVLAFARDEVRKLYPNLWQGRDLVEMRLAKLTARATEQLLDAVAGSIEPSQRRWIVERADGNPFFAEELVRSVRPGVREQNLPDSVVGMIQARLAALGTEARAVMRAGSVYGASFKEPAVRALLGREAPAAPLASSIRQLVEGELLVARGASDEREYVFCHALVRDAAYALLPDEERTLGHRLAAEWLERQEGTESALLAQHFEQGGEPARAAPHYRHASGHALEAAWFEEVVRCGERALACGLAGEARAEVSALMAEALSYSGDDGRAIALAASALAELPAGSPGWWRAVQVASLGCLRRGLPELDHWAEEMLRVSACTEASAAQVIALAFLAVDCFRVSRTELGLRLLERASSAPMETSRGRPHGCIARARATLALTADNLSAAVRYAEEALDAFRQAGAVGDVSGVVGVKGYLLARLGKHEEARRCYLDFAESGRRLGARRWINDAAQEIALIELDLGHPDAALRPAREAIEGYRELGYTWGEIEATGCLAQALSATGCADEAAELAREALTKCATEPALRAVLLAVLARVELGRGHAREALEAAEQAMALVRDHALYERVAFTRAAHIEALLACGQREAARAAASEAAAWLSARAAHIDDADLRRSFLENVAENAQLFALAAQV